MDNCKRQALQALITKLAMQVYYGQITLTDELNIIGRKLREVIVQIEAPDVKVALK